MRAAADGPLLRVTDLAVDYRGATALAGVSFELAGGEALAVLGPNGAGKTTLLRALSGLLRFHGGRVRAGRVEVDGVEVVRARRPGLDPAAVVALGLGQVMEGRRVFADLTVDENLRAGAFVRRDRAGIRRDHDRVLALFPALGRRRAVRAGLLSGGEQQMLAVGRALMSSPRLLLLDEPSLGLAPQVTAQIGEALAEVNRRGTALVVVEQQAPLALALAPEGVLLERGAVVVRAPSPALAAHPRVRALTLGAGSAAAAVGR